MDLGFHKFGVNSSFHNLTIVSDNGTLVKVSHPGDELVSPGWDNLLGLSQFFPVTNLYNSNCPYKRNNYQSQQTPSKDVLGLRCVVCQFSAEDHVFDFAADSSTFTPDVAFRGDASSCLSGGGVGFKSCDLWGSAARPDATLQVWLH